MAWRPSELQAIAASHALRGLRGNLGTQAVHRVFIRERCCHSHETLTSIIAFRNKAALPHSPSVVIHSSRHRAFMSASKKKQKADEDPNNRVISHNRKAKFHYELLDELECGIVLVGSEVKSVRNGKMSIDEAYATMRGTELWLVKANISEYDKANVMNHEPTQARKLLAHRRELAKFAEKAEQRGFTLVPTQVLLKRGYVKVTIALAKGRKVHDNRETIKREQDRKMMREATLKHRR